MGRLACLAGEEDDGRTADGWGMGDGADERAVAFAEYTHASEEGERRGERE